MEPGQQYWPQTRPDPGLTDTALRTIYIILQAIVKVRSVIVMNEWQPVGSVGCKCQTFSIERQAHDREEILRRNWRSTVSK